MVTKSDKYGDYIKDHPSYSTAEQTFYEFPNGYGASVIYGASTYDLELAVLKWDKDGGDWEIDYTTPITNDVVGHIEELDLVLGEIYDLPEEEDLVNHPSHYQGLKGLEVREVMENFVPKYDKYGGLMSCDIKDAIKYILRAPDKNGLEDLQKAQRMIKYAIDSLEVTAYE